MWTDNDSPGCLYDTTDCKGTCCRRGKIMYDRYLDEKYGYNTNVYYNSTNRKEKIKKIFNT